MLTILYFTGVIAMAVPNLYRARLYYREWLGIRSFHTFLTDNPEHLYSTWHSRDELWLAGERAKRDMMESLLSAGMSIGWMGTLIANGCIKGTRYLTHKNNQMAPKSQIDHAAIREEEGF
jgi:hypothetical protein